MSLLCRLGGPLSAPEDRDQFLAGGGLLRAELRPGRRDAHGAQLRLVLEAGLCGRYRGRYPDASDRGGSGLAAVEGA